MHRRQVWILNAILAIAAILLGWRLAGEWTRGKERYARLSQLSRGSGPGYVLPHPSERALPSGDDVVERNLFTPDRNSAMEPEAIDQTPPPLPVVFGTMKLGQGYEALMVEGGQSNTRNFRRVKSGEQVGPYSVVEIRDEKVVVEFQGQKTDLDVYQSANSVARAEARPAPVASPVVETAGSLPPPSPTPSPASSPLRSAPAVPSPASELGVRVTIEGNRRRFERNTPFGPQVWFEEIQK